MSLILCGCCGKPSGSTIETRRALCKTIPYGLLPNLGVVGRKRLQGRQEKDHNILVATQTCAEQRLWSHRKKLARMVAISKVEGERAGWKRY